MMRRSTFHQDISTRFDVDASNVAVDQTGSVVALDTNKGLFLITLDRPDHIVNILRHKSKKKHRVVRWNPHSSMSTILAMSDNNVCKVWDVRKHKAQTSLKQHTALISDMCFSLIKKNILATCSKDSHTLIWDIRSNSKRSVKCVASTKPPSSKVLFHPNLEHILATANGPDISIWDTRKSSESVNTFRAHSVAGVDNFIWLGVELGLLSFGKEEKILKLFDASSKSDTLRQSFSFTSYPLQQVLRVPFSRRFSLLTTSQRGDHQIRLWTNNLVLEEEKKNPLHVMASGNFERCHAYIGHSSTVVSCDWRIRGNQRQIVSWSTDRHLSLWQVHESHLRPQEEGSRDVPKRPDNVVIQTASPKVESSKGFSFDLDSTGFTLSSKKPYRKESAVTNSLKDDADEAEDDMMVTIDKLDDELLSSPLSSKRKSFGSLMSFVTKRQDSQDSSSSIMSMLKTQKKAPIITPPPSSYDKVSRHRPLPPCGTIAVFDKSNALILFNIPKTTPRRVSESYRNHKTFESWLSASSKSKLNKNRKTFLDRKSSNNGKEKGDDGEERAGESDDAMSLLLMIDGDSKNLPLSHPGNIVAASMTTTTTKTMMTTGPKEGHYEGSKDFAGFDSDSDASSFDDEDMLFLEKAFGPQRVRPISDPDHSLDVVTTYKDHLEVSSPVLSTVKEEDKIEKEKKYNEEEGEEEEEEFSLDGGNSRVVESTNAKASSSSLSSTSPTTTTKVSSPMNDEKDSKEKMGSENVSYHIMILNTTSKFPELLEYGRIRYDLYSSNPKDLCTRNINTCKRLNHGTLSKRCWTSLCVAFGNDTSLNPIVASTLPLMCNMLFRRHAFESAASLASVGLQFVLSDKMTRQDRDVLRSAASNYADASFQRREDLIAHTFLRRVASSEHVKKEQKKEEEEEEKTTDPYDVPPPPLTPPSPASPRTSPSGRLRRLFSRSLMSTENKILGSSSNISSSSSNGVNAQSHEMMCSLCRLPVRGLVVSCSRCGCGGHVFCLRTWFESESSSSPSCPSGCDCRCSTLISTESSSFLDQKKEQAFLTSDDDNTSEDEDGDMMNEEALGDESAMKLEYSVLLDERDGEDFLHTYLSRWGVGMVDSEW